MIKYTRKDINLKTQLHDKLFVTTESVEDVLMHALESAIKAGADEDKLLRILQDEEA